jgi:hypothetical protein
MKYLENWFYNYNGALLVLSERHGAKDAKKILDAGLSDKTISLGVPPKSLGFCCSFDGITWFSDKK